jgi:LysR family glycine cleavage system transcriptional activator
VKMPHSKPLPPMEALRAVLSASSTGSFSAAAVALNVTHGAISRRVALVEDWAGISIFWRHGRGVRLTLEGQRVVAQIEQALALLDDSARRGQSVDALDLVRVSVVPSFARLWLMPNLVALEGTPADLRIDVDIDQRVGTLSDARIAVRHGRGDWPGVSAVPLFEETLIPVANGELASQIGDEASPESLLRYPLIGDSTDTSWRLWFTGANIEFERRPQDRTFADYDMTLLAAADGLGIALLRDPFGLRLCQALKLQPVSTHRLANQSKFFVVSRIGSRSRAVSRLVDRILAAPASPPDGSPPTICRD